MIKRLAFISVIAGLLAIASCEGDGSILPFPEECLAVAGLAELYVNDTLQVHGGPGYDWIAVATLEGVWSFALESRKYHAVFNTGASPFTDEELNTWTNEEWAREIKLRGSHSIKNGIKNGKTWLLVVQPNGSQPLYGDNPADVLEGNVTIDVEARDNCELLKVSVDCLISEDPAKKVYKVRVSFYYPYHYK